MKKKRLMDYTAGYRVLIVLGILCSAGEAVLELLLPQVMSDIVDIGIKNADRNYILMAGLKMVLMALVALALGVGAAVLASKAGMGFGANLRAAEYRQVQRFSLPEKKVVTKLVSYSPVLVSLLLSLIHI